jgi:hypothetical protein
LRNPADFIYVKIAMTYASYIHNLSTALGEQDKQLTRTRELMKEEKGYLTANELKRYQSMVHEFIIVKVEYDELVNWISANHINVHSEMQMQALRQI